METLRLFVSLELPKQFLSEIDLLRDRAVAAGHREAVRALPSENLHLTLKFLGDTEPTRLDGLRSTLQSLAAHTHPISVRLSGGGCFPHARRPRVYWAGLQSLDTPGIEGLQAELSARLEELGFPPDDKPFHPHITLGYARKGVAPAAARRAAEALSGFREPPVGAEAVLETLALKQSRLTPSGAVHETIAGAHLGAER